MNENEEQVLLSEVERALLNQIQSDFPLDPRPYKVLGQRIGLPEDEVLNLVSRLRESGVIRRIGGNFYSSSLGYASTLCAARVPKERLEAFIDFVNKYEGVTHNYRRDHDLNVWFTFIAPSMAQIERSLAEIAETTGVSEIFNLPAERTFKIKVDFRFDE